MAEKQVQVGKNSNSYDKSYKLNGDKLTEVDHDLESDPCMGEKNKKVKFANLNGLNEVKFEVLQRLSLTRLGNIVFATLGVIILILFVVIIVLAFASSSSDDGIRNCQSPNCLRAAADIIASRNSTFDRCNDIWSYSCEGWIESHPLAESDEYYSAVDVVVDKFRTTIRSILDTIPNQDDDMSALWKAKAFYESCMDIAEVENSGIVKLMDAIKQGLRGAKVLGVGWSLTTWDKTSAFVDLHTKYGVTPFIQVDVLSDNQVPETNIIHISPSKLGLPSESYYFRHSDDKVLKAYRQLMKDAVKNLEATGPNAGAFSDEVFHFEKRIAEAKLAVGDENDNRHGRITIRELKQISQMVPWLELLRGYFPQANINDQTYVRLSSRSYVKQLSTIFSTTDRGSLSNYFLWLLLHRYLPYLPQTLQLVQFEYDRSLMGVMKQKPRWQFCLDETRQHFNEFFNSLFVEQSVSKSTFESAHEIFDHLLAQFRDRLDRFKWIDKSVWDNIQLKLGTVTATLSSNKFVFDRVFWNDYYSTFTVWKRDFFDNVKRSLKHQQLLAEGRLRFPHRRQVVLTNTADPRPFTLTDRNQIIISPILLQAPLFQEHFLPPTKFGVLGFLIARELINIVHQQIVELSRASSFHTSNSSDEALVSHLNCLIGQYNSIYIDNFRVNGNLTVGNNLADLSGMNLAFKAYATWRDVKGQLYTSLPGLEDLHDEELFFLSAAQSMCSSNRLAYMEHHVLTSSYAPDRIRVEESLREFRTTFGCNSGDRSCSDAQS